MEPATSAAASPFRLDGRLALVTGGGGGLGLPIAGGLAAAGARVVINGRDIPKLERAAAALQAEGLAVGILPFDVTDETAVVASLATLARTHGEVDILVNNAAVNHRKTLEQFTLPE